MKGRHLFATVLAGLLFSVPAQAVIITLQAELNGANEVPGPGDPDGSGFATFTIDTIAQTISWAVTVENIDPVIAAHIHPGAAGEAGPPLIDFLGSLNGGPLASADLAQVIANPSAFYYNVHTDPFQAGAIRGQLEFVSRVAEPGTAGLLILGLIGVAWLRRRT
jgi:CHRD domain